MRRAAPSTRCQRRVSDGKMSRTRRTALIIAPSSGAKWGSVLRDRHDDLRVPGRLHEIGESDNGGKQRRLRTVSGLVGAERGDAALESGVHRLQPEACGSLEHHGHEAFLHLILRYDQL